MSGDRARDRHALLLSARELRRIVLIGAAGPTRSSASCAARLRSPGRHAAIDERQLDVPVHREIADQVEGLEDEADRAGADPGALRRTERHRPARPRARSCPRSASRAGRESTAASSSRSPTGRRWRGTRPRGSPGRCRESAWVSTSSVWKILETPWQPDQRIDTRATWSLVPQRQPPDPPGAARRAGRRAARMATRGQHAHAGTAKVGGSVGLTRNSRPAMQPRHGERRRQAEHEADAGQRRTVPHHHAQHLARARRPAPSGCRSPGCAG